MMAEKEFTDFGDEDYCLVDGKIFIKLAKVFEMIEKYDTLEEFEAFLGFDMNYIVHTINENGIIKVGDVE